MSYKIALVGESYGEEEERQRMPFVGAAGRQLNSLLAAANIKRVECFITNVFNLRPPGGNDVSNLCAPKKVVGHHLGPLSSGKYIRDEYLPEVVRLHQELFDNAPNVVVALGGTAAWACRVDGSISKIRGTVASGVHGLKVLPTYHPSAVNREWSLRPVTILDLIKAEKQSHFPEIRRPARQVWIEPNLTDLELFWEEHIKHAEEIAIDIETTADQITCIGFATDICTALVIPITDSRQPSNSYWRTEAEEAFVWSWIKRVCQTPTRKVFQNGLYDAHFLWRRYGIPIRGWSDDTMLLHHALQPELPKGLGFLGSVYTEEPSWKLMRSRGKTTIKRDE